MKKSNTDKGMGGSNSERGFSVGAQLPPEVLAAQHAKFPPV